MHGADPHDAVRRARQRAEHVAAAPAPAVVGVGHHPHPDQRERGDRQQHDEQSGRGGAPSVRLADREVQRQSIQDLPDRRPRAAGRRVSPRDVERDERRSVRSTRQLRDDGEVLGQRRIDAEVDADRPDGRVVADAETGRDRARAASRDSSASTIPPSSGSKTRSPTTAPSMKTAPPRFFMNGSGKRYSTLPSDERRATERSRRELVVADESHGHRWSHAPCSDRRSRIAGLVRVARDRRWRSARWSGSRAAA